MNYPKGHDERERFWTKGIYDNRDIQRNIDVADEWMKKDRYAKKILKKQEPEENHEFDSASNY